VEFEVGVSDSAADSALAAAAAVADSAAPAPDSVSVPIAAPPAGEQWIVSFAALLVEASAQQVAREITVDGQRARIVTTLREGMPVHRVVLGPYPTRAAAERVGRQAGRPYWVYAASGG
jgi:cell division septation protein DedD